MFNRLLFNYYFLFYYVIGVFCVELLPWYNYASTRRSNRTADYHFFIDFIGSHCQLSVVFLSIYIGWIWQYGRLKQKLNACCWACFYLQIVVPRLLLSLSAKKLTLVIQNKLF